MKYFAFTLIIKKNPYLNINATHKLSLQSNILIFYDFLNVSIKNIGKSQNIISKLCIFLYELVR